ncbi:hypothetical protein BGW36DRAFT_404066 [Talaromyces proteolyticus]|uniref:SMP-LTD domain-containing protein n=1 Tax=Talaromyces proteolyticus TaxID=1131652 RepID=A0AAD4L1D6_9EURO|nr:uncharacterized protein BGW36DRAFT_404066 [Talaromyces proteolyticus]KAH8703740.1 hypothetical protein BGW36DRAFT_404066 [Talaromyces proteolyticus]
MGSFTGYVVIYILGGVTFLPLIIALLVLHAYLTLRPPAPSTTAASRGSSTSTTSLLERPSDDQYSLKSGTDVLAEKFQRAHESDVAAGYFAVCREYVPGGVNGKPLERTTPAGDVVASESPSVYKTMYRSIFDRKQPPTIEPAGNNNNNNPKNFKKARNVFYIVLRHGHLMLYDDEQQVEVRHVISLAHHDVSIYGGGEDIPEGELYIKRNAICLARREDSIADLRGLTPPFYLFSETQSGKEDFYHALLKNQEKIPDSPNSPPSPQLYNVKDIVKLVQDLHSSEEHLQTRWFNAMLGRLFLALYKTPEMHEFVRNKITKKISRVPKPNFISRIALRKIDMGQGAPFITNPRLKDLTVDGDCTVEADVNYSGNFRIEISATARIDLGQRFKAREVDLVLAVVLKKLTGHMLFRFKPPPSNRIWFCFASNPDMTMSIEPIVSARQITYTFILRAIESRIREVVEESLVLPHWDDVPFLDTISLPFRGGVWQREIPKIIDKVEIPDETEEHDESEESVDTIPAEALKSKDDRSSSTPDFFKPYPPSLKSRKSSKSTSSDTPIEEGAASSSVDKRISSSPPEAIRARTFSNVIDPIVTLDHGKVDRVDSEMPKVNGRDKAKRDATSSMIEIKTRSQSNSISSTPYGSPRKEHTFEKPSFQPQGEDLFSTEPLDMKENEDPRRPDSSHSEAFSSTVSLTSTITNEEKKRSKPFEGISRSLTQSSSDRRSTMAALGTATAAAAKKWGWNVLSKGEQGRAGDTGPKPGTPEYPIGRGRPLPPPGTPLPPPERNSFKSNSINVPRRKPVPPLPDFLQSDKRPVPPPPLPKRKNAPLRETNVIFTDEVLVVQAPADSSEPNSPAIAAPHVADLQIDVSESQPHVHHLQQHQLPSDDGHSDSGFEQIGSESVNDACSSLRSHSTSSLPAPAGPTAAVVTSDSKPEHEDDDEIKKDELARDS